MPRPRVVVVGGGFAGRRAERRLRASGRVDVTLVDAAGFFEYTPSSLRCCVRPEHALLTVLPQPPATRCAAVTALELSHGDHAPSDAACADKTEDAALPAVTALLLSDGARLPCDFVLFATGSAYAAPIKAPAVPCGAPGAALAARRAHYRAVCVRLEAAQSVLVVGGGTVGVELAAEIAAKWGRRKPVTLVAAQARALHPRRYADSATVPLTRCAAPLPRPRCWRACRRRRGAQPPRGWPQRA
jgi:cation diffusion facilitator CzcD-associated flavoprotein CzcO